MKAHKGKVRFFFKHYPLDFHQHAMLAAEASMAAHAQGKFWEYHDKLFANQSKLTRADLEAYAKELQLDLKKFRTALDQHLTKKKIERDMEDAAAVKVSGTPTFFVNGRQASLKTLGDIVKDELKRNKKLVESGLTGDALYTRLLEGAKLEELKKVQIFVGDAPTKGPDDAPVTLVAFGDFKCGTFGLGATTILQVFEAYQGKVRLAFKHAPHHAFAQEIAQAAVVAQQFGLFWEYYQKLIANKNKLERNDLIAYARQLGIDEATFKSRMDLPAVKAVVDADAKIAKDIGLKNTVGFYVNGIKINNPSSFAAFKKVIDKILIAKGFKEKDLPEGPPPAKISLAGVPVKGAKGAPVLLAEFSDFQ